MKHKRPRSQQAIRTLAEVKVEAKAKTALAARQPLATVCQMRGATRQTYFAAVRHPPLYVLRMKNPTAKIIGTLKNEQRRTPAKEKIQL